MSDPPSWTRAPKYPGGDSVNYAYEDPPKDAVQWCALAGATNEQKWARDATCYLVKPGVTPQPGVDWNSDDYQKLTMEECQQYMDPTTHVIPAYRYDASATVAYTPEKDADNNYWPRIQYDPGSVNQCARVLSIEPWTAQ
jgi:hypothetical protein